MEHRRHDLPVVTGLSAVLCLGTVLAVSAIALAMDESTKKQPNPTEMHPPDENRQITVGGADYFVEGELLGIDGQRYTIKRHESGEQVRVVVNQDTNLDCSAIPASRSQEAGTQQETITSERIPPDKQAPEASKRQIQQGQRKDETARGGGFQVGQCHFQRGDMVKAEVDDMGRVTTLKFLASRPAESPRSAGRSAMTGELGIPDIRGSLSFPKEEKPGQLDMTGAGGYPPSEYWVVPVPFEKLKQREAGNLQGRVVHDSTGAPIGQLERLIMDTGTGRVEYFIMSRKDTNRLVALPWVAMEVRQIKDESGKEQRKLTIDTNKYALRPDMSLSEKTAQDLSPSIENIVKQMENLRSGEAPPAPVSREVQEQVQPGMMTSEPEDLKLRGQAGLNVGGQVIPPDEGEQSGKPGTIFGGPATLPPPEASAPGYEGADQQAEQRRQPSSK